MFSLVLLTPNTLGTPPGWEGEGQPAEKRGRGMDKPENGREATSVAAARGRALESLPHRRCSSEHIQSV